MSFRQNFLFRNTVAKNDVGVMTIEEKRSVEILKETTFRSGNQYMIGSYPIANL